jgi:hypothetical protein
VSFIYGEIRCPALTGVHLAGAERVHLSDTPLVRALEEWTRQKVKALAEELHKAMMAENTCRSWTRNGPRAAETAQSFGVVCKRKDSKAPCVSSASGRHGGDGRKKRPTNNCKKCLPRERYRD